MDRYRGVVPEIFCLQTSRTRRADFLLQANNPERRFTQYKWRTARGEHTLNIIAKRQSVNPFSSTPSSLWYKLWVLFASSPSSSDCVQPVIALAG